MKVQYKLLCHLLLNMHQSPYQPEASLTGNLVWALPTGRVEVHQQIYADPRLKQSNCSFSDRTMPIFSLTLGTCGVVVEEVLDDEVAVLVVTVRVVFVP